MTVDMKISVIVYCGVKALFAILLDTNTKISCDLGPLYVIDNHPTSHPRCEMTLQIKHLTGTCDI